MKEKKVIFYPIFIKPIIINPKEGYIYKPSFITIQKQLWWTDIKKCLIQHRYRIYINLWIVELYFIILGKKIKL